VTGVAATLPLSMSLDGPDRHSLVFNFSASYIGGGRKRLEAFAEWFDARGGATFLIHPSCESLRGRFARNRYVTVRLSRLQRLVGDFRYMHDAIDGLQQPALYYSYGIPIPRPVGRLNWLHINNVLPLTTERIPLTLLDRLKRVHLGPKLRASAQRCEVVSAESENSVRLLGRALVDRAVISVNGSDDEIASCQVPPSPGASERTVVAVGTWRYKALNDALAVFEWLRCSDPELRMHVFGPAEFVPKALRNHDHVIVRGTVDRTEVIRTLRAARYYVSTTKLENSYCAASEGMFLSEESIVSDLPPHRELLVGEEFESMTVPGVATPLLRVRRARLTGSNLRSWDMVVREMLEVVRRLGGEPAC
jgi:glycosyltransferase involved in cell wall biosynthesis